VGRRKGGGLRLEKGGGVGLKRIDEKCSRHTSSTAEDDGKIDGPPKGWGGGSSG